ncbi:hypothetical protein N7507_003543 [Penicillium longicatenatum]|nr:hypothetical protein N7507_003543 [Penicillium longicatenatum]
MSAAAIGYSNVNEGYLKTSHNIKHDYAEKKVGGQSGILSEQADRQEAYGDRRDQFLKNVYTVIKGAIPRERADTYRETTLEWFHKFLFEFDIKNKETWKEDNLPVMMNGGMVLGYAASHEKWVWEARIEPRVIEPFARIWGIDELLVSFDAVKITLPCRSDLKWQPWPHVDQSPTRKGLSCARYYQHGTINLFEAGPKDGGLQLLRGSLDLFDKFFQEHPPKPKAADAPGQFDWYGFTLEDVAWFESHGCSLVKVNAEPGDLIIWDLRTVHYASLPESDIIRTITYATYTPANLATFEDLAKKVELFYSYECSTHWPHCNIFGQGKAMRNGKIYPGERTEPLEKPELTDTVLKLAGFKPY